MREALNLVGQSLGLLRRVTLFQRLAGRRVLRLVYIMAKTAPSNKGGATLVARFSGRARLSRLKIKAESA